MMKSGIYKITNLKNNKIYIGRAISLKDRKSKHKRRINNTLISRAIKKYGWSNFKWEVLEYCKPEELTNKEQFYFDKLQPFDENGYNLLRTSTENPMEGKFHSKETRERLSKIKKEANLTGNRNPFFGKHHTEENKKIRSLDMSKRYLGSNNPFYNKNHTEESKLKISKKNKGKCHKHEYKPVNQYDLYGNFIQKHESISKACLYINKKTNDPGIRNACSGKYKQAYGYKWEFYKI